MIRIYNTLTRKKEDFVPLEEGKVRMYVCGPTVYNFIHIVNARPMIVFDTVRRYLEAKKPMKRVYQQRRSLRDILQSARRTWLA